MSRRVATSPLLVGLLLLGAALWLRQGPLPLAGEIRRFMFHEGISGAVVVVVREHHVEEAIALGAYSAPSATDPVSSSSRFPIASLSKPITAAAVRGLIASRRLGLDDRLVELLGDLPYHQDPRYADVTVRQLLQHTAGFDRGASGDPLFGPNGSIAGCDEAEKEAVSRPLDFTPGQQARYSNVGYCLLGLIIAKVADRPYERAVGELLAGASGSLSVTVGPPSVSVGQAWSRHYSPREWRALGSAGGWFADAVTLATLLAADAAQPAINQPPDGLHPTPYYYGLGWRVWPQAGGYYLTHFGVLPGMFSFVIAYPDGRAAVALFDGRPAHEEDAALRLASILGDRLRQ